MGRRKIPTPDNDCCYVHDGHDTGESGTVGMSLFLADGNYFKLARVERGTVVWPNDEDVAPEMLWERHV